jgi:hypothetical protein
MSYCRSLKEFCKLYELDYPSLLTGLNGSLYQCKVIWYGIDLYTSQPLVTEDQSIIDCVMFIDRFVKSEKNFNNLLRHFQGYEDLQQNLMKID